MKGLLWKDFYVINRQMRFFALIILVFAVLPNYYIQLFAITYAGLLPYSVIAHDEQSHWDALAGMMPYSVKDLVLSKYILGWASALIISLVALGAGVLERNLFPQAAQPAGVLPALCVALVCIAVSLPFLFRFGSTRGRQIMMMALIVVACGTSGALSALLSLGEMTWLSGGVVLLLPLAAVVANAISVPLSMAMYRRRYK